MSRKQFLKSLLASALVAIASSYTTNLPEDKFPKFTKVNLKTKKVMTNWTLSIDPDPYDLCTPEDYERLAEYIAEHMDLEA